MRSLTRRLHPILDLPPHWLTDQTWLTKSNFFVVSKCARGLKNQELSRLILLPTSQDLRAEIEIAILADSSSPPPFFPSFLPTYIHTRWTFKRLDLSSERG